MVFSKVVHARPKIDPSHKIRHSDRYGRGTTLSMSSRVSGPRKFFYGGFSRSVFTLAVQVDVIRLPRCLPSGRTRSRWSRGGVSVLVSDRWTRDSDPPPSPSNGLYPGLNKEIDSFEVPPIISLSSWTTRLDENSGYPKTPHS